MRLIEDTGDMLIMTWAYTNYTGVGDLASICFVRPSFFGD